jgi:hypothetical protein
MTSSPKITQSPWCLSERPLLENGNVNFHAIWYVRYATGGYFKSVVFNFLKSVIPALQMLKLVRWDDNLLWSIFPPCCHLSVALWSNRGIVDCSCCHLSEAVRTIRPICLSVCLSCLSDDRAAMYQWLFELTMRSSAAIRTLWCLNHRKWRQEHRWSFLYCTVYTIQNSSRSKIVCLSVQIDWIDFNQIRYSECTVVKRI